MDGWMDGRMDGWTEGRRDSGMDGWKDERMDGWIKISDRQPDRAERSTGTGKSRREGPYVERHSRRSWSELSGGEGQRMMFAIAAGADK